MFFILCLMAAITPILSFTKVLILSPKFYPTNDVGEKIFQDDTVP